MTEDPVKLYVVVMAVLLCVLGFVAWSSWQDAEAFEEALRRAPREAEEMREQATEVQALCKQLKASVLKDMGPKTLVEGVARELGFQHSQLKNDDRRIGRGIKGKERIIRYDFGGGRSSPPQPRGQIAEFCRRVEQASQGILKTIEVDLARKTGPNLPTPGEAEVVTGDAYGGTLIFGQRVVD